jgi:acyl-CoA thioester hydrolase
MLRVLQGEAEMKFRTEIEVRYIETDASGVVHHANYLAYLELARIRAASEIGLNYAELAKRGVLLAVTECGLKYRGPAFFGDRLAVHTTITDASERGVRFDYTIERHAKIIVFAHTVLVAVSQSELRPVPLPEDVMETVRKHM